MAEKSVSCSAATRAQADRIVDRLKKANFSGDDISIQFPDHEAFKNAPPTKKKKLSGSLGACIGAGLCGVAGLILARFVEISAVGPLTAALTGAAIGVLVGGIAGWLVVFALTDEGTKFSHGNVVTGNIIIQVRTDDTTRLVRAKNVFSKPAVETDGPEQKS